MIHFHCRKCAKNILTEDGKEKPTFTDGLCENCDPNRVVAEDVEEVVERVVVDDPRDDIIANLEAQIALLTPKPDEEKEEKPPLYVPDKKPSKKKGVSK